MLTVEAQYIVERDNRRMATEAVLIQLAVSSAQGNKRATQRFNAHIKKLTSSGN